MKNFIYLIQGTAKNIANYQHLRQRKNADCILLTYDKPLDGCEFFPNSTFSTGRNKLLTMSKTKDEYLYTIFCDDDVEFVKGDWSLFEKNLLRIKPEIGIPVMIKAKRDALPNKKIHQAAKIVDEQMMAFSHSIINDDNNKILPYISEYDDKSWWISCEIQERLIRHYYPSSTIQFNNVEISNNGRLSYISKMEIKDKGYLKYVIKHLLNIKKYPKIYDLMNFKNQNTLSLKCINDLYYIHKKSRYLCDYDFRIGIKANIHLIYYNFEKIRPLFLWFYCRYKIKYFLKKQH